MIYFRPNLEVLFQWVPVHVCSFCIPQILRQSLPTPSTNIKCLELTNAWKVLFLPPQARLKTLDLLSHIELCHTGGCHIDCVLSKDLKFFHTDSSTVTQHVQHMIFVTFIVTHVYCLHSSFCHLSVFRRFRWGKGYARIRLARLRMTMSKSWTTKFADLAMNILPFPELFKIFWTFINNYYELSMNLQPAEGSRI